MKTWFIKVGVKERQWSAQSAYLNSIEHYGNELESWLDTMPLLSASIPDFINSFMAAWTQIPAAILPPKSSQNSDICYNSKGVD